MSELAATRKNPSKKESVQHHQTVLTIRIKDLDEWLKKDLSKNKNELLRHYRLAIEEFLKYRFASYKESIYKELIDAIEGEKRTEKNLRGLNGVSDEVHDAGFNAALTTILNLIRGK